MAENEKSEVIFKPIQEMKVSLFFVFDDYWPRYVRLVHLSVTPIAW